MSNQFRIIGVKRKAIDEEKLALAFLLLAKNLHDQAQAVARDEQPNQGNEQAA